MQNTDITVEDRINEIASLLATAIKRLTSREISRNRDVLLDFNAHPSVHADAENNSYGGMK